jgi:hypothetical protein
VSQTHTGTQDGPSADAPSSLAVCLPAALSLRLAYSCPVGLSGRPLLALSSHFLSRHERPHAGTKNSCTNSPGKNSTQRAAALAGGVRIRGCSSALSASSQIPLSFATPRRDLRAFEQTTAGRGRHFSDGKTMRRTRARGAHPLYSRLFLTCCSLRSSSFFLCLCFALSR